MGLKILLLFIFKLLTKSNAKSIPSNSVHYDNLDPAVMMGHEVYNCQKESCFRNVFDISNIKTVYYLYFTKSLEKDNMISKHIPWITHLFSFSKYEAKIVIADCSEVVCLTLIRSALKIFPDTTIFLSFNTNNFDNPDSLLISSSFMDLRSSLGYKPPILIHGNHDKPWVTNESSIDYLGSTEKIKNLYSKFEIVFRQYYYEPLALVSNYIPLGFASYGLGIKELGKSNLKRASQRSKLCFFAGNLEYPDDKIAEVERKKMSEIVRKIYLVRNYEQHPTRWTYGIQSLGDQYLTCNFQSKVFPTAVHTRALADSVFVLCPQGKNHETFRFYEALESGAIPVIVVPPSETNFLLLDYFKDYNGPILSSWDELPTLLNQFSNSYLLPELDKLQSNVITWYKQFKLNVRVDLSKKLDKILDMRLNINSIN